MLFQRLLLLCFHHLTSACPRTVVLRRVSFISPATPPSAASSVLCRLSFSLPSSPSSSLSLLSRILACDSAVTAHWPRCSTFLVKQHVQFFICSNTPVSMSSLYLCFYYNHVPAKISIHICVLEQSHLFGYWHQRADERHGNPPQR